MIPINQLADLFDKETVTKIKIIYFFMEKKTWVSVDELSLTLEINQRTISKYLTFIEEDIDTFSLNKEIVIKSHSKKGFFLDYDFETALEDLVFKIIEETINYQLLMKIFFSKIPSIIQFSHEYYVSESSLWRMINKFRKKLLPKGISIERRSLELIGSEIQIRRLSLSLLFHSYTKDTWLYGSTTKLKVEKIINKVIPFFHLCLSDFGYKKLFCMIAIGIERTKQGKYITLSKELKENIEKNDLFDHFFYELKDVLPKEFYHREEIGFLFLYIFTKDEVFNDSYILKKFTTFHYERKTQLFQSVEAFKKILLDNQNLFIQKDDLKLVSQSLYSAHLCAQIFHNENQTATNLNGLFDVSNQQLPIHLKSLSETLISLLYSETGFPLFKETNFLRSVYSLLLESLTLLSKIEEPLQIFFESDLSSLEEKKLIKTIKNEFIDKYKLEIYTHNDCLFKSRSMDLFLSTKKISVAEQSLTPNIVIPTEPTKLDFYTLEKILSSLYLKKNQQKKLPELKSTSS
ncbi:helix-turn-helix domain-containing protein [Enterococcus alishanensis]|uniref:Helix-turn-helix domain-containing protein n=1 Tax=Enterococcus alishanensis TaxID=1303817 RepID=A0ABS6TED8_9ENTE|nr:helix-turn-helix domain-containing protein [Enterococcus alishanensis]MBV7391194.1 helix-turn-helix domain-containing protein [Enterococcus alishanensis]